MSRSLLACQSPDKPSGWASGCENRRSRSSPATGSIAAEQALEHEAAAKVPDRRGDHPTRTGNAAHLLHRPPRVGHEVEHELRDGRCERAGLEGQIGSVRLLESNAAPALSGSREGEIGGREVDRVEAPAGVAASQLERDAAGAAADVEQQTLGGQGREVDQGAGEPRAPAAEEPLVGGPVVGMIAKLRHRVSRSRP